MKNRGHIRSDFREEGSPEGLEQHLYQGQELPEVHAHSKYPPAPREINTKLIVWVSSILLTLMLVLKLLNAFG